MGLKLFCAHPPMDANRRPRLGLLPMCEERVGTELSKERSGRAAPHQGRDGQLISGSSGIVTKYAYRLHPICVETPHRRARNLAERCIARLLIMRPGEVGHRNVARIAEGGSCRPISARPNYTSRPRHEDSPGSPYIASTFSASLIQ
jgi:hypothetical protein